MNQLGCVSETRVCGQSHRNLASFSVRSSRLGISVIHVAVKLFVCKFRGSERDKFEIQS